MYLGKIVEQGKADQIIEEPRHPYTRLLMEAVPPLVPDTQWAATISKRGELPFSIEPPSGCRFHPRCAEAKEICRLKEPDLVEMIEGQYVACHV